MKRPLITFLIVVLGAASPAGAAELAASGLSFPFFDESGKLTHKVIAQHATMSGPVQQLRDVVIDYFADGDPKRVVQRVTAREATWDEKRETLEGRGEVIVETLENRLTGDGFLFELGRAQLNIHRNFNMANSEVLLTSDRAVVDLVIQRADDQVKLRDVRRCEAIGNLRVKVLPTATRRYNFEEARSERGVYDGATHTVEIPQSVQLLKNGQISTLNNFSSKLDPKSRPALKLND